MSAFASSMTDEDVKAVAQYLGTMKCMPWTQRCSDPKKET